jgi:hypothetical protein
MTRRRKRTPIGKAATRAMKRPYRAAKRKARAALRRKTKAAMKRMSISRRVKARAKTAKRNATHKKVVCRVCGREVRAVLRHGQWQVAPHNRPTSHIRCGGVVVSGHKRASR